MENNYFHIPVLLEQGVQLLISVPSGVYVDGTLGGGGHSFELLTKLDSTAKLIGIDRDEVAIQKATHRLREFSDQVTIIKGNFADITDILAAENIEKVNGILLDLGLSSFQIDFPERGFSYNADGPLDMRMSGSIKRTAADILNDETETSLAGIFYNYGEERRSRAIAKAVVRERQKTKLETTKQLSEIISSVTPYAKRIKTLARCFQAIRIATNDELNNLQTFLEHSIELLHVGGRLVIISFHSLEDRLVKHFLAKQVNPCECPRELPYCVCKKKPTMKLLTRKALIPSNEEIRLNSRSRSSKLRAAVKI